MNTNVTVDNEGRGIWEQGNISLCFICLLQTFVSLVIAFAQFKIFFLYLFKVLPEAARFTVSAQVIAIECVV